MYLAICFELQEAVLNLNFELSKLPVFSKMLRSY